MRSKILPRTFRKPVRKLHNSNDSKLYAYDDARDDSKSSNLNTHLSGVVHSGHDRGVQHPFSTKTTRHNGEKVPFFSSSEPFGCRKRFANNTAAGFEICTKPPNSGRDAFIRRLPTCVVADFQQSPRIRHHTRYNDCASFFQCTGEYFRRFWGESSTRSKRLRGIPRFLFCFSPEFFFRDVSHASWHRARIKIYIVSFELKYIHK